ncbi:MAG: ComF family protein [Lentisphaerae bacterium]|nr:ComF family protein [Lentisphaerota bacterium]
MRLLSRALDLVYPRICAGCGTGVEGAQTHMCWTCRSDLPVISFPYCSTCGDPVDGEVTHEYQCSWCLRGHPQFDLARSAVRYRGSVRRMLQAFKYEKVTGLEQDFVPLLAGSVGVHYGEVFLDAVLAVPLHPVRERDRTYNQAGLLARGLARTLGLPAASHCLRRVLRTRTQTNLTARERRENVARAFHARNEDWIEGRRLLLVDDVMTTGATVNACAGVLKEAGAAGVYVLTVARG